MTSSSALCNFSVASSLKSDFFFDVPRILKTKMSSWILLVLSTLYACQAGLAVGEQDIASPLRVAQCRATCLEKVTNFLLLSKL